MKPHSKPGAIRMALVIILCLVIVVCAFFLIWWLDLGHVRYGSSSAASTALALDSDASTTVLATSSPSIPVGPPPFVVTHISTPAAVKAVYYTSWAAGNGKYRRELYNLIDKTEVNAVVIDVKDYTGHISFMVDDPDLKAIGSAEDRIPDIKEFIGELHKRGVYVIGRISSFQDSYLINVHPEWAVKTKEGAVWHDYKGVKWLDAGAQPVWDYLIAIGNQAHEVGFDEMNFDYIRFPSDGDLEDISYSWGAGRTKAVVIRDFFSYLHDHFASTSIPISADLFGLTTSASGDLGIGQVLENALPFFDYVDPMVYPSHFANGFLGYAKPATKPYEVVKYAMDHASTKAENASSTPAKLRPWLQAFDLGAIYTPALVRAQVQATYDSGLDSWLLWNAASVYNPEFFAGKDGVSKVTFSSSTASR